MRAGMLLLPPEAQVETDAEGAFLASDLSPGEYFVSAEKAGFVPQRSDAKLEAQSPPEPLLITLWRRASVLSGTVKDPRGNAVANAFVAVAVDEGRGRDRGGRGGPGGGGPGGRPCGRPPRGGPQGSAAGETEDGEACSPLPPLPPRSPGDRSRTPPSRRPPSPNRTASGSLRVRHAVRGQVLRGACSRTSSPSTVRTRSRLETPADLEDRPRSRDRPRGGGRLERRWEARPRRARVTFGGGQRRQGGRSGPTPRGTTSWGGLFPGKLEQVVVDAKGFSVSMLLDVPWWRSRRRSRRSTSRWMPPPVLSGIVLDAEGAPVFNARVRSVMPACRGGAAGRRGRARACGARGAGT